MMEIYLSTEARQDLEDIYAFFLNQNPTAAANLYNRIIDELAVLKDHPLAAPAEQYTRNQAHGVRSLVIVSGRFKSVYFVDDRRQRVVITQVFDCRQSPEKIR